MPGRALDRMMTGRGPTHPPVAVRERINALLDGAS
jgi:hypothetical protein